MWKVLDDLYVGTEADAGNGALLTSHGISHIVNCARELPDFFPSEFQYLRLDLDDPDERMRDRFAETFAFVDAAVADRGRVLVHCQGAVSRSPAIVLAYLCHQGSKLSASAAQLSAVLPTRPNGIFLQQVAEQFDAPADSGSIDALLTLLGGVPD